jgi:lysophospholipase L1-like esterase
MHRNTNIARFSPAPLIFPPSGPPSAGAARRPRPQQLIQEPPANNKHRPFISPVLLALTVSCASAAEQIVTLGDSLTFAYEAEFCFQKTITIAPSITTTIGDNMPARVRNWIEILSNPANRGDRFDLGARDSVTVTPPLDPPFDLYLRQSYNWAIPGLKIDGLRRFVTGDPTATFTNLLGADAGFSTLGQILNFSNFSNTTDFNLTDLQNQIQNSAERLTIAIGGNDIKEIYATVYNGGSAGTFVADFMADMVAIVDAVQTLNPTIQIVLVNVPHVGITPNVRVQSPYDPIKTELVSAVLRDLNGQLAALAASRGIGYADIYKQTVSMIDGVTDLIIHGVPFNNGGTATGTPGPAWIDGPISKNFHPNTSGQIVFANEIIHAFNKRYGTGIALLSSTEIHENITPKSPVANYDMIFENWMTRNYLSGLPASNDKDGDGIPAGIEFALGLNPTVNDADRVSLGIVSGALELAYPIRLPVSAKYTLVPESSATPGGGFTPFGVVPTLAADGLAHARLPLGSTTQFVRLKVTIP